jgi:hypothetical protein
VLARQLLLKRLRTIPAAKEIRLAAYFFTHRLSARHENPADWILHHLLAFMSFARGQYSFISRPQFADRTSQEEVQNDQ